MCVFALNQKLKNFCVLFIRNMCVHFEPKSIKLLYVFHEKCVCFELKTRNLLTKNLYVHACELNIEPKSFKPKTIKTFNPILKSSRNQKTFTTSMCVCVNLN